MTKRTVLPAGSPDYLQDLVREVEALKRRVRLLEQYTNINTYTVATLPAVTGPETFILVSDETGGFTAALSDGANWRRVQDLAVVS